MSKKSLTNGVSVKVENRSGFDKSFFNSYTTGVGTLTPHVVQYVIPNSDINCRLKISAQLPPLASDAFLRTHLKAEAFFVPRRICYGGYESWFCGKEVYDAYYNAFVRAQLPQLVVPDYLSMFGDLNIHPSSATLTEIKKVFGEGSLADYLGLYVEVDTGALDMNLESTVSRKIYYQKRGDSSTKTFISMPAFDLFSWIAYGLIYDEYYRNKLVERPLFSPPSAISQGIGAVASGLSLFNIPYVSFGQEMDVLYGLHKDNTQLINYLVDFDVAENECLLYDDLLNGRLCDLRQRNYGDDYLTCATPSPQEGSEMSIDTSGGSVSISSIRLSEAMQEFKERNNWASPDYIQTLAARFGASLSQGIAQKPIYLGSADFPMYTSPVEQAYNNASGVGGSTNNPFSSVGARYGRAHAEGSDFVCKFHADEDGYFIVIVSLVPEAQYSQGIAHHLLMLNSNELTNIPCSLFEHIGNEPIHSCEIDSHHPDQIFGYVQRFLGHKLGNRNQVHGKFRASESLDAFVVQRYFSNSPSMNSDFLKVKTSDLDNVYAVSADKGFGVMIDSAVDLFVSEPLSESSIPALANPASEHGRSVYIKTGGSKLA